ncbi:hypothetical protein BIW11_13063 [Tropilaelaps mercedesae]|uniref:Secreted protein n=1 Tax=Tropilaelaps mercedesae TaxID=418985 RepID=A0A1V9X3Y0_9ACAR|nr:hypothetical protein BIW11_13063 [Tropilaelaps mercedesae]
MFTPAVVVWTLSMAVYCSGLKAKPWLPSKPAGNRPSGLPLADKYSVNYISSSTNVWGCAFNETLVLYTIWPSPMLKTRSKAIKLAGLRSLARARCCPNPGPEEHLIPGEICPMGHVAGENSFLLPQDLTWAPSSAPCANSPPVKPACCSEDAKSYCQFIHDRTPQESTTAPIGNDENLSVHRLKKSWIVANWIDDKRKKRISAKPQY